MKTRIIIHNKIRCKKCGEIIESFSRHDFKWCSCGTCAVDGGHDYLRRCGNFDDWEDLSECKEIETAPKYKVGDIVLFYYVIDSDVLKGRIMAVDTCPFSENIEYDIMLLNKGTLYKHINERNIIECIQL